MSSHDDEAERIQAIAASMAVQLHALFPDGYSPEDPGQGKQIQECFQNLVDPQGPNFHPGGGPVHHSNHLRKAIPIAVQQWKELQANTSKKTAPQPKSFSLLDQWTSGGFAFPTVTVTEILELPTIPAQLQRLQEIQYLEDILADWNDVKELLFSGLEYAGSLDTAGTTADESSTSSVAMESLRLHRKWFHEARTSREYLKVQYDLVGNLTKSLQNQNLSTPPSSSTVLDMKQLEQWRLDRLRNWHDMLVDLMERDEYVMEEMKDIELFFLQCLGSESKSLPITSTMEHPNETSRLFLSDLEMLALLDPQAHGFGLWIHHVSLSSLQSLLEQSPQVLSMIWHCCTYPRQPSSGTTEQNNYNKKIMTVRHWYCMSVLRFLVNKLRVVLFPWNQLQLAMASKATLNREDITTGHLDTTSTTMTISELQYQVLDLFVEGAIKIISDDGAHASGRRAVCYEAIETMLWGLGTAHLAQVKERISPVEYRCSEVWQRIQSILIQVEQHG